MFRFFLGLVLAQTAVAVLVSFYPAEGFFERALPVAFLIMLLATVISLWFSTIARQLADRRVHSLQKKFTAEKDKLSQDAERAKDRLIKKTKKQIELESRRAKTKASIKVWGAIAVAGSFGAMMLLSQFVTLGLLTLTTAGGAIGGYLVRARKEQDALDAPDYKLIEAELVEDSVESISAIETVPASDPATDTVQPVSEKSAATQSSASG